MPCQGKWQDRSHSTVVPTGKYKFNSTFRNIEKSGHSGNSYQKETFLKFASYLKILKNLGMLKTLACHGATIFSKIF